jgi:hypothetical protein
MSRRASYPSLPTPDKPLTVTTSAFPSLLLPAPSPSLPQTSTTTCSPPLTPPLPLPPSTTREKQLKASLSEIVSSEISYVKFLNQLKTVYSEPLRTYVILTVTEHEHIFSNFDVSILPLHAHILSELTADESVSLNRVISIFSKFAPYLSIYKNFVSSLGKGLEVIQRLLVERPLFLQFIDTKKAQLNGSCEPLESLLLMPVQRIPRYVLLLKEVLKYTNYDEKERVNLENVLSLIQAAASKLDQNLDDNQRCIKLREMQIQIQPSLPFSLLTPPRRMILDGKLLISFKKRWIQNYVALVAPDMLVYGIEDGVKYHGHSIALISGVIKSDDNDETIFHIPVTMNSIPTPSSSSSSSSLSLLSSIVTFKAESIYKASKWIEAFLSCRAEIANLSLRISTANAAEASFALRSVTMSSSRPTSKSLPLMKFSTVLSKPLVFEIKSENVKDGNQEEEEEEEEEETKSRSLSTSAIDLEAWAVALVKERKLKIDSDILHRKTASDDAVNSLRETVKRDAVEQSTLLNNEAQRLLLSFIENGENAAIFLRKSL